MAATNKTIPSVTKLDAVSLNFFIEHNLTGFINDLVDIRHESDDLHPLSLFDLNRDNVEPLTIGALAKDEETGGKSVVANAKTAARSIDEVLERHKTAFSHLKLELTDVVKTMLQAQGSSLVTIDGQKFLTAIQDYDHGISGTSGTGTGSGTGSGSGAGSGSGSGSEAATS